MYYATKRNNNQTRMIGAATVVLVNIGAAVAIMNGFGSTFFKPPVESEVVMIEEPEVVDEEPPPPPPIDVDLPPPPPQVILPDFVFNEAPPENAIQQVVNVPKPQAPVAAKPTPAPVVSYPPVRPVPNKNKFSDMMSKDYPARALRAKQEGDVTVSMCVSIDGRASDVKLVTSSGIDSLDDATVKGMSRMTFTPAKDSAGKNTAYCSPPYVMTVAWKLPKD